MLIQWLLRFSICFTCCLGPIAALSPDRPAESGVDTLVLCSRDLQETLTPWVRYRQRQGHVIAVCTSLPTAAENKKLIAEFARNRTLKTVLLVGDSGDRWLDPRKLVPTDLVTAKVNRLFGSEAKIATDNPYADLNDDGIPDLSVGRLTADSTKELASTISRIIRYEQQSSGQSWQRKINLIAGIGGFGKLIDTVIENTTREIITDLIPAGYQTSMTYGSWTSPYCPDPRRFSETAIERFNDGCLFWVYCGHGNRHELDKILLPDRHHRILDCELVQKLDCRNGSPIAICLSCYTGAHDGNDDCLAEFMMRQPNGPVAVVCGSRITMPYAMSVLSVEMMNEFFRGDCDTLGELLLKAKQRMLAEANRDNDYRQSLEALGKSLSPLPKMLSDECLEHAHLMQLIGDPLLKLKRPGNLHLKVDADQKSENPTFAQGDQIRICGTSESAGTLQVEIAYKRGRLRYRPMLRQWYDSSDEALAKVHQEYLKSQNPVCARKQFAIGAGEFSVDLEIPKGCRGDCDVRAMLLDANDVAVDSVPIRVLSDRQARRLKKTSAESRTADRSGLSNQIK